jgi:hypothetical protein
VARRKAVRGGSDDCTTNKPNARRFSVDKMHRTNSTALIMSKDMSKLAPFCETQAYWDAHSSTI